MIRGRTYSISKLLSSFFALFSIAMLLLSAFYFSSFSSIAARWAAAGLKAGEELAPRSRG